MERLDVREVTITIPAKELYEWALERVRQEYGDVPPEDVYMSVHDEVLSFAVLRPKEDGNVPGAVKVRWKVEES